MSEALSRSFLDVDVEMGVENGRLMAYLAAHGEVLSKQYRDSRVMVHCRIPPQHLGRIRGRIDRRPHRTATCSGQARRRAIANSRR